MSAVVDKQEVDDKHQLNGNAEEKEIIENEEGVNGENTEQSKKKKKKKKKAKKGRLWTYDT